MISASFSLGDTNTHNLADLLAAYSTGTTALPPCYEFTELTLIADAANAGTIAVGDINVSVTGKIYSELLAATSPAFVQRKTPGGQRIYASTIYVKASAATQVLHLAGSI